MRRTWLAIMALAGLAAAAPVSAQGRWSLEARAGTAFPNSDFGGADLSNGSGFIASAQFRVVPMISLYGGWSLYRFTAEAVILGRDGDVRDTGYTFGVRIAPLLAGMGPWMSAGGIYNHAELEIDPDVSADSDPVMGWEVGAGLSFPFGRLLFTPGFRYRSFSPELDVNGILQSVDVTYLAAELGLMLRF